MNIESREFTCPICGFPGLEEEPYHTRRECSYEICPSCGFQFGYDDMDRGITFVEWRKNWIGNGMKWWSSDGYSKPLGWNPRKQLNGLASYGRNSRNRLGFVITYKFLSQNVNVCWQDICYGLIHKCITIDVAEQHCNEMIMTGVSLSQEYDTILSSLDENEIFRCVQSLAGKEKAVFHHDELSQKWLFVILLWVYEHRNEYGDPLMAAQVICDDFGSPPKVTSFVWHMLPQNVDNDTIKARDVQMMANWRDYIDREKFNWKS